MQKKIVVVGSSNVDYVIKGQKLPAMGQTVTDGEFLKVFGGKGANQALAAARAGGQVTFISCLGNDVEASQLISNFSEEGIDTRFMFIDKEMPTGAALIMLDSVGNNYLSVAPGANYSLTTDYFKEFKDAIVQADVIVLQMEIPIETTEMVIEEAGRANKMVIFNAAPYREFDNEMLKKISILVVNETEAESITGQMISSKADLHDNVELLLGLGVKTVIITLGDKGVVMATESEQSYVPAFKVNAQDTTAAGDTFCGNLAVLLAENKSLYDSVRFASAASAICVTRMGAQPSVPYRNEIIQFVDSH